MGVYIGFIEKIGYDPQIFFNFRPIGEVRNSQIIELLKEDLDSLLPESEKHNINFQFSWNDKDSWELMDEMFDEKSLAIFEFTLDDLQPNFKQNGERNPTGYKVQVIELIKAGKIYPIDKANVYYAVRKKELLSDFSNDIIVEIDVPNILSGNKVFVDLDGFWAGPYEVAYRDYTSSYYIKPNIKENKYTVNGYSKENIRPRELLHFVSWEEPEIRWSLLIPKEDAVPEQKDMITEEALLESFRDTLQSGIAEDGRVNLDEIPILIDRYDESYLAGSLLTQKVRENRLNRIRDILSSEADIDRTLGSVADSICDLLIKYKDRPNVESWLQATLEKYPSLIDQLKETKTISERIAQKERELDDLQQQRAEIEQAIATKKAEANEIDHAAVEAKKTELLQMDAEYAHLCEQLEAAKKTIGLISSIDELTQKQSEYKNDVSYLETHKRHLETETQNLELQFQQLISRSHEQMVNIAFDGFMASKLLHAAAEWEAAEEIKQHEKLVSDINSIPAEEKTPKELIEYLCRAVQKARPTYSKNTIVNIAICLTQGFLTVFSGEPGCGKTSICNIFGDVLGLNQFGESVSFPECSNRYIPVSVERGWTSKRDFVGYYNPLSKTFDKSNRRVYDALHQLDTEKKKNICNFPFLILLDEANLSPMEYYWSDFMNICDDLGTQSCVNLGENFVFEIPETLHFLATINNDHTTETLSPRLIDRAWIISLPQQYTASLGEKEISADIIEKISWASLKKAFLPQKEECVFSAEVQKVYDAIVSKLKEKRFLVSPRIDRAIKRYWASASKHFEMDETKTDAQTVALDYAVAQRLLPKIIGNGDSFEKWLDELRSLCSSRGLNMSAKLLKDIIERGNQQMKYYQFFC